MGTEWRTLTQGTVPLDGTSLTTAIPDDAATVRLKLSGELSLSEVGVTVDAVDADTPSSLIQIDPGQWHMVEAHPDLHTYVFVPTGPLTRAPAVRLDLQTLETQFGFSRDQAPQALTGRLTVELAAAGSDAPLPFQAATVAGFVAGFVAAFLAAAVIVHRARHRRPVRGDDSDLETILEEIRGLARAVEAQARTRSRPVPKVVQEVGAVVASAERLHHSTLTLRQKLRAQGVEPREAPVEAKRSSEQEQAGDVPERDLLDPLVAEEQRLRERLEKIRDALSRLLDAMTAGDGGQGGGDGAAEARLEDATAEITAVLANRRPPDRQET